MNQIVCGIDPSLTNTGICYGQNEHTLVGIGSKTQGQDVRSRILRYENLVAKIDTLLEQITPSLILIEAYAYSRNMAGQMFLGEFGGILRFHLVDRSPNVIEVAPNLLKKFVTGKGNAPKEVVQAHLAKRYGLLFDNSDEADAFVLWKMGCVMLGKIESENQAQREAIEKVLDGVGHDLRAGSDAEPDEIPF